MILSDCDRSNPKYWELQRRLRSSVDPTGAQVPATFLILERLTLSQLILMPYSERLSVGEFIPGEPGDSPHWNAHLVNTAVDVTVADIVASPYVSAHYPEALFDDVEDILGAEAAGLVTVTRLGVVVLCPIISEKGAEAPGNTELSEDFPRPWPETF